MASRSFSDALANLTSEKIKDRTQGLEDVRLFLSVPRNIDWMNQEKKPWLKLLQAIFQIVVDEQRSYVKKASGSSATSPALKRLKDASQAVRLIIEKCASDIPRKAFKAVFSHIVSIIVLKGRLFEPVALDYLRALRALVEYRPHLEHLETKQWTQAVALLFSGALGDNIRSYELVEGDHNDSGDTNGRNQDDEQHEDDDVEVDELVDSESEPGPSSRSRNRPTPAARKRKASALRQTGAAASASASSSSRGVTPNLYRSASQDVIEIMGCIETFFRSSSSPFMEFVDILLAKFTRFLRAYPSETSAHLPALRALNLLVDAVFFNAKVSLERSAVELWPHLLMLWTTKNILVKEQLVMLFTSLQPFLVYRSGMSYANLVQDLYHQILVEPDNRWGVENLDLYVVEFGMRREKTPNSPMARLAPFENILMRAASSFTPASALTWAMYELGAACLAHLIEVAQSLQPDVPPTPVSKGKGKKRKLAEPLESLLSDLRGNERHLRVPRLHMLAFLLAAYPTTIRAEVQYDICASLEPLIEGDDVDVQSWAMIVMSILVKVSTPLADAPATLEILRRTWRLATRMSSDVSIGRYACLLASTFLHSSPIDRRGLLPDLEQLAKTVESQGPARHSETTAQFLCDLIHFGSSDVRLFHLNMHQRIFSRINSSWDPLQSKNGQTRPFGLQFSGPHQQPFVSESWLQLLCEIASVQVGPAQHTSENLLPTCAMTAYKVREREQVEQRDWFFRAVLPTSDTIKDGRTRTPLVDERSTSRPLDSSLCLRIVMYLGRTLRTVLDLADGDGTAPGTYWNTLTIDRLRRVVDVAVLALSFEAILLRCEVVRNEDNIGLAARILAQAVPRIMLSKWTSSERAFLLDALWPILIKSNRNDLEKSALLSAGLSSGIREAHLAKSRAARAPPGDEWDHALEKLWFREKFQTELAHLAVDFESLLASDSVAADASKSVNDGGFGIVQTASSGHGAGRMTSREEHQQAWNHVYRISLAWLVTKHRCAAGNTRPVRLKKCLTLLIEGSGSQTVAIGQHFLSAVQAGYVELSASDKDAFLERLGGELLPSYDYAHSQDLQLLVLQFLQATVTVWGKSDIMELGFVDNARRLGAWFAAQERAGNLATSDLRRAFIDLLSSFLSPDLDADAWGHESEETACDRGVPIPPMTLLIRMLGSRDYLTRFRLARVLGELCSYVQHTRQQDYSIWQSIAAAQSFDLTPEGYSNNSALLLTYGNIMVASDYFRAPAYEPIVLFAALDETRVSVRLIRTLLEGIASRLGLSDVRELYTFLASFTMAEQLIARQERLVIPDPTAFGFGSKKELYDSNFSDVAAMVLAGPRAGFFDEMCSFSAKPRVQALIECFPGYAACKLAIPLASGASAEVIAKATEDLAAVTAEIAKGTKLDVGEVLLRCRDATVYKLFACIWESDYDIKTFRAALGEEWPGALEVLAEMLEGLSDAFQPNVLSPPDIPLASILTVLNGKHRAVEGFMKDESVLYAVLHRLLTAAESPPFVSQQLRLLYNAAICIAVSWPTISRKPILMLVIMRRLASLLSQSDLVVFASRIFSCTFKAYKQLQDLASQSDRDLPRTLSTAAVHLLRHSKNPDQCISSLTDALLNTMESFLQENLQAGKDRDRKATAIVTACLWPRTLPLHASISLSNYLQVLKDPSIRLGSLSIASHISKCLPMLPSLNETDATRLSTALRHFLVKVDPGAVDSDRDVARQLVDLVRRCSGRLVPPALSESPSAGQAQPRTSQQIFEALVGTASSLLARDDLAVTDLAHRSLRGMLVAVPSDVESSAEVALLRGLPPKLDFVRHTPKSQLQELLQGDKWLRKASVSVSAWRQQFAALLARHISARYEVLSYVGEFAAQSENFARSCLADVLHLVLVTGAESKDGDARATISGYFLQLFKAKSPALPDVIDALIELRRWQPSVAPPDPLARDAWLAIPWNEAASAAASINNFEAGLMFLELARDSLANSLANTGDQDADAARTELLQEIFSNLDEPDSFYGIHSTTVQDGLLRKFEHESRWRESVYWHGGHLESELSSGSGPARWGPLVSALARSDLPQLSMTLYNALLSQDRLSDISVDVLREVGWKTGHWDLPGLSDSQPSHSAASSGSFFAALREHCVQLDPTQRKQAVDRALVSELRQLTSLTASSPAPSSKRLSDLLGVREIARWQQDGGLDEAFIIDQSTEDILDLDIDSASKVADVRVLTLQNCINKEARSRISDEPTDLEIVALRAQRDELLRISAQDLQAGKLQRSLNAVLRASQVQHSLPGECWTVNFRLATVVWAQGEHAAAIRSLNQLDITNVAKSGSDMTSLDRSLILSQLGTWIAEARLEAAISIQTTYFEPAIANLNEPEPGEEERHAEILTRYGNFAYSQYQAMGEQVAEIDRIEAYSKLKQTELRTLDRMEKATQTSSARRDAAHLSLHDRRLVEEFRRSRASLLNTALVILSRALALTDKNNDLIYKITALWLANAEDDAVNSVARKFISIIPSYKFIPLIHQLSARLSTLASAAASQATFQSVLHDLITRLCVDHPFHALFQVYFLRQGVSAVLPKPGSRRTSGIGTGAETPTSSQIRRAESVNEIIQVLRKKDRLKQICSYVELALQAYIEWANLPNDTIRGLKKKVIPQDMRILKLADLPIPVTTYNLPIDKTCKYETNAMPCIRGFKPAFATAGGIHLPKITECVGSDGRTYTQLYKGGDDVRQDAVMEQIFAVANEVLKKDDRTKMRSLKIRTYKVLPLTNDAGLLEFVSNSVAIGAWLVRAHETYNPTDWPIKQAREELASKSDGSDVAGRIKKYKEITEHVRPVMRHFFTERQYIPTRWFEMRLNYSRTAAVMSMVGHILGLGDRHVSNIMIDKASGELVPIDFGIMFEAGKSLPTPEKVPFRLTRDMVDGLGRTGVEGVFRRCSEETMRVMREQAAIFMTILDVFKFDPLQKWSASAAKLKRVQGSEALDRGRTDSKPTESFTDAERAISTVAKKLKSDLSVEYQVNDLILQATDVNNLGAIYYGWQPYL